MSTLNLDEATGGLGDLAFDDYDDLLAQLETDLTITSANLQDPTTIYLPGDLIFSGAASRAGALLCDGAAVSRTTYSGLFSAIGTAYGAGDGSTTFNLPDMRGCAPIGADPTGVHMPSTVPALGQSAVGAESTTLTLAEIPSHNHGGVTGTGETGTGNSGVDSPDHAHTSVNGGSFLASGSGSNANLTVGGGSYVGIGEATSGATARHSHGIGPLSVPGLSIASAGGGSAHSNVQPSTVGNWFIKT